MASYKTRRAARDIARKELGADWASKCQIMELDGAFYIQINQQVMESGNPALIGEVATLADAAPQLPTHDMDGSRFYAEPAYTPSDLERATAEENEYLAQQAGESLEPANPVLEPLPTHEPLVAPIETAMVVDRTNEVALSETLQAAYKQGESEFYSDHAHAQRQADALANQQQATSAPGTKKEWVHASSIPKPTKQVWNIADAMVAHALKAGQPLPTRKEVQDECVRRGIASGTARTQYQAWKKANDETLANAAKAAELSKRFNGSH